VLFRKAPSHFVAHNLYSHHVILVKLVSKVSSRRACVVAMEIILILQPLDHPLLCQTQKVGASFLLHGDRRFSWLQPKIYFLLLWSRVTVVKYVEKNFQKPKNTKLENSFLLERLFDDVR
jgi:hypothetical protein